MANPVRNVILRDDRLPAVEMLLGEAVPAPLRAAVGADGAEIVSVSTRQVTWWPGRSISVRYRARLEGLHLSGTHDLIAVAGKAIPKGALMTDTEGTRIGVWRMPDDPRIPGLAAALDPDPGRGAGRTARAPGARSRRASAPTGPERGRWSRFGEGRRASS